MISRRPTIQVSEPVRPTSWLCGLLAGIAQAGVFNPYDRALYLSVKDNRSFLHVLNWKNPYIGFSQSLGGRALSGGLYFPVEHFMLRTCENHLLAGFAAGTVNAIVLNPLTAVKYKTWGRDVNRGMWKEAYNMLNKGRLRPFFRGLSPTIARDVVFGGTYTYLRLFILDERHDNKHTANFVAAALATVASGPFNYARNVQFSTETSAELHESTIQILYNLGRETNRLPTLPERLHYLQSKLRIGWGTARVALGMTFAHGIYDWLSENLT